MDSLSHTQPCIVQLTAATGGQPVLQLQGGWNALALARPGVWAQAQAALEDAARTDASLWDLTAIQRMDHLGAQMLWDGWGRRWPDRISLLEGQRAMLERVARFSVPPPPPQGSSLQALFQAMAAWMLGWQSHLAAALRLLGQLALDVLRLLRAPGRAPWRDISSHLYRVGATALPITALVGFLVGVVLAYLMARQLRQFGADVFIVNILGIALIRELGPVLAAILIAGRSGSAITAQIGVMRVTEELDAMRVLGIPKGFRLVLPRAMAMAVAMPLLAVWTTLAALVGSMLAADVVMGMAPGYFVGALPRAVQHANLWLAVAKSTVFGVLIALIGCHFGLRVRPDTQSLGEGTTASVVTAITMVIVVDALFAVLFKGVGL
jgi:phospholipid/cholesterol/gamma-HCH transport system permease protein